MIAHLFYKLIYDDLCWVSNLRVRGDCQTNGAPKDIHVLIAGTCEYVTLHSKGELRVLPELQLYDREIFLAYPCGSNVIRKVLESRRGQSDAMGGALT